MPKLKLTAADGELLSAKNVVQQVLHLEGREVK